MLDHLYNWKWFYKTSQNALTVNGFIFPVSLTDQLEHLTLRCVVGSGVTNVDKCGRSQRSWLLGALSAIHIL